MPCIAAGLCQIVGLYRQGDSLSPILFALFINGLADDIKNLNKGIDINGKNVSILLYADDIVLISESEVNLQYMLDYMHDWCHKWKLKLNITSLM